jgi:copper chaperone CopZ
MKTIELQVTGMSCGHCVAAVRSALALVEGVHEVDVSLSERRATVRAEDGIEEGRLVRAVEQAGYQAAPRSA